MLKSCWRQKDSDDQNIPAESWQASSALGETDSVGCRQQPEGNISMALG